MATTPPVRKRKTTTAPPSLVEQARSGEPDTTAGHDDLKKFSVRLPVDLLERVWGACADPNVRDSEDIESNVAFTIRAFESYLDTLEATHNDGQPYHATSATFGPGRRLTYKR